MRENSSTSQVKIGFIGAGRAGLSMASCFKSAGHLVKLWDISPEGQSAIVDIFGREQLVSEHILVNQVDWLVIALPDQKIKPWVMQFSNRTSPLHEEVTYQLQGMIHLSGALGLEVFEGLPSSLAKVALHPMRAFSKALLDQSVLEATYFGITASDPRFVKALGDLLPSLKSHFIEIPQNSRVAYHMAAVMASNYVVPMLLDAKDFYLKCGIDEQISKKLVSNLVSSTLGNFEALPEEQVLTGPLVRGDVETVQKHLKTLSDFPEHKAKFLSLTAMTLEVAKGRIDEQTYILFKELIEQSQREVNV